MSKLPGPLIKVTILLAKNVLAPLGITAAASGIDAGIQQQQKKPHKKHGSGTTTLIISNEKMNDIIKLFKLLKILIFYWKESLKQLKIKQKTKRRIFKWWTGVTNQQAEMINST